MSEEIRNEKKETKGRLGLDDLKVGKRTRKTETKETGEIGEQPKKISGSMRTMLDPLDGHRSGLTEVTPEAVNAIADRVTMLEWDRRVTKEKTTVTPTEVDEIKKTVRMHSVQLVDDTEKVDELSKRLMETDSTVATVGQRQEKDMEELNALKETVNGHELRLKADQVQIGLAQKMIDELRADLTPSIDKLEELDILRDKVRSQEAVIAELEGKVAKMERDVGDTFAETGRMIRDVKDESAQRAEEIAKEMETRLMERAQEDTETKLKEATRIQDKDITVMKQRMENVFSRMRRVEEDPSVKALRAEVATIRRDLKVATWSMVGAVVLSLVCGVVTIMSLAGVA